MPEPLDIQGVGELVQHDNDFRQDANVGRRGVRGGEKMQSRRASMAISSWFPLFSLVPQSTGTVWVEAISERVDAEVVFTLHPVSHHRALPLPSPQWRRTCVAHNSVPSLQFAALAQMPGRFQFSRALLRSVGA